MEKVVLKEDIEAFIKALNEKLSSFYNNKEIASTVFYTEGKKYYKILQKTPQIKLINEIWKNSYIINKQGAKIFSFSYFRDKMKENNISEELLGSLPLKSELKIYLYHNNFQFLRDDIIL